MHIKIIYSLQHGSPSYALCLMHSESNNSLPSSTGTPTSPSGLVAVREMKYGFKTNFKWNWTILEFSKYVCVASLGVKRLFHIYQRLKNQIKISNANGALEQLHKLFVKMSTPRRPGVNI